MKPPNSSKLLLQEPTNGTRDTLGNLANGTLRTHGNLANGTLGTLGFVVCLVCAAGPTTSGVHTFFEYFAPLYCSWRTKQILAQTPITPQLLWAQSERWDSDPVQTTPSSQRGAPENSSSQ